NSKEQAVRWVQTHGMEAGNIAREMIDPTNKLGDAHINNVGSQAESLSGVHSTVNASYSSSSTKAEIKSTYNANAGKLAESSSSSSTTGDTKSLTQNTENNIDTGQKMYNTGYPQGTSLQNIRSTISEDKDKIKKEFDNTPKSTAVRVVGQVIENASDVTDELLNTNKKK
ncbi:MAG: hypothetical protein LN573_00305, partial [Rickettsia endosymbiont of Oxypoda opaca]|nr:hypothetical protein [Rickettsia endosymbiont of Oxypoda opaca]